MIIKRALAGVTAIALTSLSFADDKSTNQKGDLWLLTGISYETVSSSNMTTEFGLGWYGLGGGVNYYAESNKQGLMYSARVGDWGFGYALNAGINYVGKFNDSLGWRLGVGLEYLDITGDPSGLLNNVSAVFPYFEASLGIKM